MNLSLGEYRALAAKAFRGAGYSWGLTEDAGFAARRLAEFGLPSGEIVARLLKAADGVALATMMPADDWSSSSSALCPICVGATLADQGGCSELALGPTLEPLLIAPFLMTTLQSETSAGYSIEWPDGRCDVTSQSLQVSGAPVAAAASITIANNDLLLTATAVINRIDLQASTLATLEEFAARTYAPATEASRNAGAG